MAVTRRQFVRAAGAAAVGTVAAPYVSGASGRGGVKRCIVFGFDGMDPDLAMKLMKAGRLPHFAALAEQGFFSKLGTSTPPQSPVAWSNFIAGANPGTHGIFDFIARDAATRVPYLSTARVAAGGRTVRLGNYRFPLSGGDMENLRRGPTLWRELEARGIPCTVLRIPANFPPVPAKGHTLSGLGTPDLHGGYGIFTCYTDRIGERTRDTSGGHFERVRFRDHVLETVLPGPQNTFALAGGHADVPFVIRRDPSAASVRIQLQGADIILRQGEWSDWVPVRFGMVPHLVSVSGICRFFLKSAREDFVLYVSPVNIDPADPAMPVTTPAGFGAELDAPMVQLILSLHVRAGRVAVAGWFLRQLHQWRIPCDSTMIAYFLRGCLRAGMHEEAIRTCGTLATMCRSGNRRRVMSGSTSSRCMPWLL